VLGACEGTGRHDVTTYTRYDAYGNVLQKVDANNITIEYRYDARKCL
jgi:hypothetical protein